MTVVVAWLTKVLVEEPVRRSTRLRAQPRMTFAGGAAASAVVVAVLAVGPTHVQAQIRAPERQSDAVVAQHPPCFGAAARDPQHPCENRALALQVVPAPVAAEGEGNGPCPHFRRDGVVSVCEFGVPAQQATRTVALIGDSHASHWRAPLDAVARERGWHGLSVTRSSCPFSTATKLTPEPARTRCALWVQALPAFFGRHPEIDTIFASGITGGHVNVPPGRTTREAKVNGYRNAWKRLPDTIKHIVVIRDNPKIFRTTVDCIDRAIADHRQAGTDCAVPRRTSLQPDPQAIAARDERSPRLQVVDLTRVLCNPSECFPVIGGALVYKDLHHFTLVFAETLAAPLGQQVEQVARSW